MNNYSRRFLYSLLVVTMLSLTACGGGGSDSGSAASNNGGGSSHTGRTNTAGATLSTSALSGSTLVVQPDDTYVQAGSSRTYRFYNDGTVDYTFESVALSALTVTMQWEVEGDTLYINNGDRFSGTGSYKPQQLQFPQGLRADGRVVTRYQTLEVRSFSPGGAASSATVRTGSSGASGGSVSRYDLEDTVMAFSVGGSRNVNNIHYMLFFNDGSGAYLDNENIQEYEIKYFTWSMNNGSLSIDYTDSRHSDIRFLGGYTAGALFNDAATGVVSSSNTQYTILEVADSSEM